MLVAVVVGGKENDLLVSRIVEYLETSGYLSEIELRIYMRDDKSEYLFCLPILDASIFDQLSLVPSYRSLLNERWMSELQ